MFERTTNESALMKLRYKESAGRREPEQVHLGLKAVDLKLLTCKELHVKVGNATKVELVGRLLSPCQMGVCQRGSKRAFQL